MLDNSKLIRYFLLICALSLSLPTLARQSCEWPFRTEINVQSANALSDYQVKFELNASSLSSDYDWSSNGDDLYIYDTNDTSQLEFWIESWDGVAEEATVWVRFPTLSSGGRSIYLYYGNPNATDIADAPFTFTYPGIKFHTRRTTTNPNSLNTARTAFNNAGDSTLGYGCKFVTNFTGITNRSQNDPASQYPGSNQNFAAFSESFFYADEAGSWQFRYGADFGRGGALYVNGTALEEQWTDDLWWANNWGNGTSGNNNENEILRGSITLTQGYHKLEILGFEGGNDGGITAQFKKPSAPAAYANGWQTLSTGNIDIRSRACPALSEPTYTIVGHDVCEIDLGFDNTLSYPNGWVVGDTRPVTFGIENLGTTHPSLPDTRVAITLGAGLSLSGSSGANWSCSVISATEVECLYSAVINQNGASSNPVTLDIATTNANPTASFSATVYSKQFEDQLVNNTISNTLPVWTLDDDITPACAIPKSGLFAGIYNSQGYSDAYADSEAEFDTWESALAIRDKLDGQIIFSQLNVATGNPFNVRSDDYYFVVLEGYIYVEDDGFYNFAVDGDDAVELKINDVVISSWYGGHGTSNNPFDENTIGLSKGFHKLDYRMQEATGGDSFYGYWRQPTETVTTIIPTTAFFHCAGDPDIRLDISVVVQDDMITSSTNDKAIPGATLRYTAVVTNEGDISSNGDSMELILSVSDKEALYVDNLTVDGPIIITDGTGNNISGIGYDFDTLTSITDGLSFSDNNGADFDYSPTSTAGFDSSITHFKLTFSGSLKPKYASGTPEFTIEYEVMVE